MVGDSPPPIVTFRREPRSMEDVHYDMALELVGHVHQVIEHAVTRFHLKNRLDRSSMALPIALGQVREELRSQRWRSYRTVMTILADVGTVLDIMARQRCTTAAADLLAAQLVVDRLRLEIRPLANPAG